MESGRPCREVRLLNHPLIHAFSASSVEGNSHEGQVFLTRLSNVRVNPFWGHDHTVEYI